ncbi:MAG: hypothetical protein ACKO0V_15640, partial [bacterium]
AKIVVPVGRLSLIADEISVQTEKMKLKVEQVLIRLKSIFPWHTVNSVGQPCFAPIFPSVNRNSDLDLLSLQELPNPVRVSSSKIITHSAFFRSSPLLFHLF